MAKMYKVAVIGRTGKGNYGHGLVVVWNSFENVEVVAVADEDPKGRADAQKRIKAKNAYADYKEMLARENPNIVSVADRFLDQHRDMVIACAEHKANMFLEKPITRTLVEADEMVLACERNHVKLAIAHQTRYSPKMALVKKLIKDGLIGDIIEMHGRGKEDARGGGQDLMVLGTHIMDLMRYFAGDAKSCTSRIFQEGKPAHRSQIKEGGEGMGPILGDQLWATYAFENGVMGTFGSHKAKFGAGQRFGLFIYGSKGVIHLATGGLGTAWFLDNPSWAPGKNKALWQEISTNGVGKPETIKDGGLGLGNQFIVQDLFEAIEKDRQPIGSIYDGRSALEMILAVYESFRVGNTVELPLKNRKHPLSLLG